MKALKAKVEEMEKENEKMEKDKPKPQDEPKARSPAKPGEAKAEAHPKSSLWTSPTCPEASHQGLCPEPIGQGRSEAKPEGSQVAFASRV